MTSSSSPVPWGRKVRRPDTAAPIAPLTEVRAGSRVVARATTQLLPSAGGDTLHVHLECAAGHQPPWARRLLVHDLLTRAERAHIERVLIVLPLDNSETDGGIDGGIEPGIDSEILNVLREHCPDLTTRRAGTTCIVDAVIRPSPRQARAM